MTSSERLGDFQLVQSIALGGMAEVFVAKNTRPGFDKKVCLKRVRDDLLEDEEFLRLFRDEAALAARLHHPNVVEVFDFGEEGGQLYLTMELIDGLTLAAFIVSLSKAGAQLPLAAACAIAVQLCRALFHAHTLVGDDGKPMAVVHRDVSPQNVLLGRDGSVKLADFGIARAAERLSRTVDGMTRGKARYMAPEQARGEVVDHRADQFALGIVLWEMLTGKALFKGDDMAVQTRIADGETIDAPSSRRASVPASLDAIVARALAPDVAARYPDMEALERELMAVLDDLGAGASAFDLRPLVARALDEHGATATLPDGARAGAAAAPAERAAAGPPGVGAPLGPPVPEARFAPPPAVSQELELARPTRSSLRAAGEDPDAGDDGAAPFGDGAVQRARRGGGRALAAFIAVVVLGGLGGLGLWLSNGQNGAGVGEARGAEIRAPADDEPAPRPKALPGEVDALMKRATDLLLKGQTGAAMQTLRRAQKLEPDRAEVYRYLAIAYENDRDWQQVEENLQRYLELSPRATDRQAIESKLEELKER
jgi:tetratricopeptide (TPR) repeat protein